MKKRLIYQVYVGKHSKLYDHCIESVKAYCHKNGIEHHVQTEPILKILPDMNRTNRNKNGLMGQMGYLPIFEKENAFDYLDPYDQVAVIDSDIYIRPDAPNIFDDLPEQYDFGGVLERSLPLTPSHRNKIRGYSRDNFTRLTDVDWNWNDDGAEFFNMGMMVMNKSILKYLNGQTPEQFIRRPEFKDLVDGIGLFRYSTDQLLLNYWLKRDGVRVKHMDWRWNAMYRGVQDNKIPEAHFIHFFLKQQLPAKGENVAELMKRIN